MKPNRKENLKIRIVGVGASAGGMEALRQLFGAMQTTHKLAFVVVQHLLPDQASQLAELLAKCTPLSVHQVEDGMRVVADSIYIAAPGQVLTLKQGILHSHPANTSARANIDIIDTFFESLAATQDGQAIAVILSGTGSDGAAGAISIKQAGGLVFVQEPASAMYNGMPIAAIATGAVDHILSLKRMAEELQACTLPSYARPNYTAVWRGELAATMKSILDLIHRYASVDLSGYKLTPLIWRVHQRMQTRQIHHLDDYQALLQEDASELEMLVHSIPIHTTGFFRDPEAWQILEHEVIAKLMTENGRERPIRAWTPACATGEEAYTLAMLLSQHLTTRNLSAKFQVFATDASSEITASASRGVFSSDVCAAIPLDLKAKYFYTVDNTCQVKKSLREKMVFAPQNLLADPPFSSLDLITCRNLLIYLEPHAINRVLYLLHTALRSGGYLFLGKGESLSPEQRGFESVFATSRIYRKSGPFREEGVHFAKRIPQAILSRSDDVPAAAESAHRAMLKTFELPSVQFSRQELDASREELQVLNEELRAVNDQLNLSNEEISKVNQRLNEKIEELETQSKILSSGAVMTLFLDRKLLVRWFTPAMRALFPLTEADIGRSISDLRQKFNDPSFSRDISAVLKGAASRENEVEGEVSTWYLRQIRPFGAAGNVTGVAITFADITDRKKAELILREREKQQAFLLKLSDALRSTGNASEAQVKALRMLEEYLEISQALYFEIDSTGCLVGSGGDYAGNALLLIERIRLADVDKGTREVYKTRRTFVVNDIADLALSNEELKTYEAIGIRSAVGAPITKDGKFLAMLIVCDRMPRIWSPEEVAISEDTAERVWAAVERTKAETALAEELDAMSRLRELSAQLLSTTDLTDALYRVLDTAIVLHRADKGTMQMYDPKDNVLRYVASRGFDREALSAIPCIDRDVQSPCAAAIYTGQRIVAADIPSDRQFSDHASIVTTLDYKATISTPLKTRQEELQGVLTVHFREAYVPTARELRWADLYARLAAHLIERRRIEEALHRSEAWLGAQKEAFKTALEGTSLAESLNVLVRTAAQQADSDVRCAFYIANYNQTELFHVAGMSDAYAECVNGFRIGPDSLACGLAAHTGRPVITPDVMDDPRWEPWRWLAKQHGYRAVWSFPVEAVSGQIVGTFAMYFESPRDVTAQDVESIAVLTRAAAIIISRNQEIEERKRTEVVLRESEAHFRAFISATSDMVYSMNADWSEMQYLEGKSFISDTHEPTRNWLEKYIPSSDQRQMMEAIHQAIQTKSIFQLEHSILAADGKIKRAFSRAIPILDAAGNIIEWFGAASDITARASLCPQRK